MHPRLQQLLEVFYAGRLLHENEHSGYEQDFETIGPAARTLGIQDVPELLRLI
jgi:hypothetical protein